MFEQTVEKAEKNPLCLDYRFSLLKIYVLNNADSYWLKPRQFSWFFRIETWSTVLSDSIFSFFLLFVEFYAFCKVLDDWRIMQVNGRGNYVAFSECGLERDLSHDFLTFLEFSLTFPSFSCVFCHFHVTIKFSMNLRYFHIFLFIFMFFASCMSLLCFSCPSCHFHDTLMSFISYSAISYNFHMSRAMLSKIHKFLT